MFDPFALGLFREARTQLLRGRSGVEADLVMRSVGDHWRGKPPQDWIGHVFKERAPAALVDMPQAPMSRSELRDFLAHTTDPQRAFAAILAWGGSDYRKTEGLVETWSGWTEAFQAVRGLPAEEQYEAYKTGTADDTLRGIGPAFFTKAIFFTAPPDAPGYIMDQWTARSANVLSNTADFILLTKGVRKVDADGVARPAGFSVSPRNTSKRYSAFNAFVVRLAQEVGCTAEQAELLMFSKATWWRAYVASRANEIRPSTA